MELVRTVGPIALQADSTSAKPRISNLRLSIDESLFYWVIKPDECDMSDIDRVKWVLVHLSLIQVSDKYGTYPQ